MMKLLKNNLLEVSDKKKAIGAMLALTASNWNNPLRPSRLF
jgi:hypothetical protein